MECSIAELCLQELDDEGNYRQAEHHYKEANDWKAAVNMYRGQDMWDEAYRVMAKGEEKGRMKWRTY